MKKINSFLSFGPPCVSGKFFKNLKSRLPLTIHWVYHMIRSYGLAHIKGKLGKDVLVISIFSKCSPNNDEDIRVRDGFYTPNIAEANCVSLMKCINVIHHGAQSWMQVVICFSVDSFFFISLTSRVFPCTLKTKNIRKTLWIFTAWILRIFNNFLCN